MRSTKLFFLILLLLISVDVSAGCGYSLSEPQAYEICFTYEIKNSGGPARELRIAIPVMDEEELPPYQKIHSFNTRPNTLKAKVTGGSAAYFIPILKAREAIAVELDYFVTLYAIKHQLYAYSGGSSSENAGYLAAEPEIESDDPQLIKLASQLTSTARYPLDKAVKIFDYVNEHLHYEAQPDQSSRGALETLRRGGGNCVDFSLLYIALCRAVGIPARFVAGYRFSPSEIGAGQTDLIPLGHAWAEINLPALGWITVEPTYIYTLNREKQVNHEFFGGIQPEDRHLFLNYSRNSACRTQWKYNPRDPAKIEVKPTAYIRRLR